jgi:hypothetical protein
MPNRRKASSKNVETIRDRWGIDAHSEVEIQTNKDFSLEEGPHQAEIFALDIINEFIKRYRYYAPDSVHLIPLIQEDFFGFNLKIKNQICHTISLAGGIRVSNPLLTYEVSEKMEQSINDEVEIPFWNELLLNAEQFFYQAEYRHSILESVIALELVVSNFIRTLCEKKNISISDADEYIKNIGLTGNIKITLKLLLGDIKLPKEKIFEKCKSGITLRNNIVHKGQKNTTENDAKDTLDNCRLLVKFLTEIK